MTTSLTRNVPKEQQNGLASAERTRPGATFVPRFDIWENDDELVLYGDLPGVKAEDLDIRYENNQLIIFGRVCARNQQRRPLYGEYGVGDFYRSFTIGENIDPTKISAEISSGVLTLHLPKTEEVKPRRIEVQAN